MTRSIEQRLAALERQNRTLRRVLSLLIGALGVTVLATLGLAGREPPPKEITAESFTLADKAGRTLATLSNTEKGARLQFLDETGKARAFIGFDPKVGPRAGLLDDDETIRVALAVTPDGAGVKLIDARGNDRLTLGQCSDCASIGIEDEDGHARAELGYKAARSFARVCETSGSVSLTSSDRSHSIAILDDKQVARAQLEGGADQSALFLSGAEKGDRVSLSQNTTNSGLFVSSNRHPRRIMLAASAEAVSLQLCGATDKTQMIATVNDTTPSITIRDEEERTCAVMAASKEISAVAVTDPASKSTATLTVLRSGAASVAVLDADGKETFSGPPRTKAEPLRVPGTRPAGKDSTPLAPESGKKDNGKLDLTPAAIGRDNPR